MRKRMLLGALAALAFTTGTAAPASADPLTVPGCYGAGSDTVCDLTITNVVNTNTTPYPVCAGSCVLLPVPGVEADWQNACVSYSNYYGQTYNTCVGETVIAVYEFVLRELGQG